MSGLQRILSRVRIHGGDSGVSARATHHIVQKDLLITYVNPLFAQAELRTVRGSTTERKKMSTKTTFKRIALVTVAALGMGVLTSVAPASATDNALIAYATGDGAAAAPYNTGRGIAGPVNTVAINVGAVTNKRIYVTITGGTVSAVTSGLTATVGTGTTALRAAASTTTARDATETLTVTTPTAGTVTINAYTETAQASGIYAATPDETVTITVGAAGVTNVYNAAKSTVYGYSADTATPTITSTDDAAWAVTASSAASTTPVAAIQVTQKDGAGSNLTSGYKVVSVLTTIGTLQTTRATNLGAYATLSAAAVSNFWLAPNGQTGTGTVTVSIDGVVAKTYTVNFYSTTVKTLTATTKNGYITAAAATGFASAGKHVAVVAKDLNNNAIASLANLTATSSNEAVATVANPSWDSTDKVYYAVVTGVSAGTAVITVKDSTGLISSTATVNVTSAIAKTVTITFDKATYAAGEKMTVSINATNAAGAKIADGTYTAFLTGALVASASLTSALYGADLTFDDGIATATAYAPLSSGPLSVTATIASSGAFLDSALLSTTVTGTTKVSGTAELASLTTLVNSLLTKINAMQKLLNKIQKKLGVK